MFEGSSVEIEVGSPTWDAPRAGNDWQRVDRKLRAIAKRRSALDAEEARWLREAERLRIWRPLGMVSALDYMERVLGYTPHAARERLRVANALGELPAITASFAVGELAFSSVRELTRVATADTDAEWRDAALGKSVREIEDAVAGRPRGSRPSDPADPEARMQIVRLELRADVYARLRQTQVALAGDVGHHLDDNELVGVLCEAALERLTSNEPAGRAKFQVSMTVCECCRKGWQHGGGAKISVDDAAVDQALCDAQHIGSIDGDGPQRASQDIPPAMRRFIWHRDGGRCQTPGCRSAFGLEIHHIDPRANGGTHAAWNLTLRCGGCHRAHHEGRLTITGTAPDRLVTRRREPVATSSNRAADEVIARRGVEAAGSLADEANARSAVATASSHVGRDARLEVAIDDAVALPLRDNGNATLKLDSAIVCTQVRDALVTMGWKPAIAREAVEAARSHVGRDAPLDAMVRAALRCCPLRSSS